MDEIKDETATPPAGFKAPNLREPKWGWGMAVRASVDLTNDGSHPAVPDGALLAAEGTRGEIQRVGHLPEADNEPIYLVEFEGGTLVGCLEHEIAPLLGDRVSAPGRME